jgi:ATP-dependent protease ClpP protease subunit
MMFRDDLYQSYRHPPVTLDTFAKLPNTIGIHAVDEGYDLLIYDVIGCGCVEVDDIAAALAIAAGKPIRVRINSVGGDCFAGFAIYNLLLTYAGAVSVIIDGIAASAAAYIAMAGDTIEMMPASFMMIHNGWTFAVGDRHQLAVNIEALTRIDDAQVTIFANRTGMSRVEVAACLDAETWYSAQEAVDVGLADDIIDPGDLISQPALPSDPDAAEDADEVDVPPQMPMNFLVEKRRRQLAARLLSSHAK